MEHKPQHKLMAPLIKGNHWHLIEEYVADEKGRLVTQLLNCNELSELKKLQGEVIALDKLLNLKAILKQAENPSR